MKDFEARENANIEHVRNHFKRVSDLYGFSHMDPSPIESLSTLETKSGPAIRDEIYHFRDKGDREVALRFDFTMGLTRYAAAQKSMRLPAKISAFGGVFRYDEPQKGRYRYFHQWDAEIYGKPGLESDSEIVEMTSRLFDSLRLEDITIDISHRRLVESHINKTFGSKEPRLVTDILRAVDKISKKPKDEILREFEGKGYGRSELEAILDFSQIRGTVAEVEDRFDTSRLESWDELRATLSSLENKGVANARINFGIVRGLDYYSGMVFEVFDRDSDLGALAGGGRYDALTGAFGRDDIGAAGVAGGVERIILTMRDRGVLPEPVQRRVAVVYVSGAVQREAFAIASALRLRNIPTDIDLAGRSAKKQMDAAAAAGAGFSIIVGPREIANGNVVLHNMKDGKESQVPLTKLREDPDSVIGLERPS